MYFDDATKAIYQSRHNGRGSLVAFSDVLFAVHATIITAYYLVQVFWYRRPNEGPSMITIILIAIISLLTIIGGVFVWAQKLNRLDYLYILSYVKVALTMVKYIPQVWMNWARRSTEGWSITNVLLDFFGGLFSVAQLLIDGYNHMDWGGITGFLTKLALGGISMIFDVIFMLQHYTWFPQRSGPITISPKQSHF